MIADFGAPIHPGLRHLGAVERGGNKPSHVVIKGENHHVLEALQFTHAGKVDCIYIDPPYNTGARDWKYDNDYVDDSDAYRHSKWLAFMERRLFLAKQCEWSTPTPRTSTATPRRSSAVEIANTTGDVRDKYRKVQEQTSTLEALAIELRANEKAATRNGNGDPLPQFEAHLFADAKGLYPAKLNDWETEIVSLELARPSFVAWYRNPARATPNSLRIAYENDAGAWASLQVDFVVISRRDDGSLGASIVDPHGDYLADAKAKLLALAQFAEEHGDSFVRIWSVSASGGGVTPRPRSSGRRRTRRGPCVRGRQGHRALRGRAVDALRVGEIPRIRGIASSFLSHPSRTIEPVFDRLLDDMRSHSTEWLERRRTEVVDVQRRMHSQELAIIRVLDERGRIDPRVGSLGESPETARQKLETARRLESLPNIAAAACDGRLSDEQLDHVVQLADDESDAQWADRAPHTPPMELSRLVRNAKKPSTEDSRARQEARSFWMRWNHAKTMLRVGGALPDVMGAQFEKTIDDFMEAQRPAKGEAWDTFEHRAADALVAVCESAVGGGRGDEHVPSFATRPVAQLHVPLSGPAEFAGVPIADSLLEQWRANVSVEPVVVDDDGVPLAFAKRCTVVSPKILRAVLLRDRHCRICGSTRGLHVHHLRPRTWGGTDDISGLALVCSTCHRPLVPHGPWALVGNPNLPDGLRRVHLDDLTPEQAEQLGRPPPRPG